MGGGAKIGKMVRDYLAIISVIRIINLPKALNPNPNP